MDLERGFAERERRMSSMDSATTVTARKASWGVLAKTDSPKGSRAGSLSRRDRTTSATEEQQRIIEEGDDNGIVQSPTADEFDRTSPFAPESPSKAPAVLKKPPPLGDERVPSPVEARKKSFFNRFSKRRNASSVSVPTPVETQNLAVEDPVPPSARLRSASEVKSKGKVKIRTVKVSLRLSSSLLQPCIDYGHRRPRQKARRTRTLTSFSLPKNLSSQPNKPSWTSRQQDSTLSGQLQSTRHPQTGQQKKSSQPCKRSLMPSGPASSRTMASTLPSPAATGSSGVCPFICVPLERSLIAASVVWAVVATEEKRQAALSPELVEVERSRNPDPSKSQPCVPPPTPSTAKSTAEHVLVPQTSIMPVFDPKPVREYKGHTGDILDLAWSKVLFTRAKRLS